MPISETPPATGDGLLDLRAGLQRAAERVRGAPVRFVEATPVTETYRGAIVWEGLVSEFESAVGKVYAWAVEGDREPQFAAVLARTPSDSPAAAVKAWFCAEGKIMMASPVMRRIFFPVPALLVLLAILGPLRGRASDAWPQFRGPNAGHTEITDLPLNWSETEHVKWKTALPGEGWSSPVVAGKQVWMTTALEEGQSLHALCCDLDSGRLLLDLEVFRNAVVPPKHKRNSYASPSPIIDGDRVYVHFGSMGTACLSTKDGHKLWENREFVVDHQNGPGGSPALYEDKLLLAFDGTDQQYEVALNKMTGQAAWKTDRSGAARLQVRPTDMRKAYGSPTIFQIDGRAESLSTGAERLYAYDPATGRELWTVDYPGFSNVPLPITDGRMLYICTGFMKPELWALRMGGAHGDATASHVVWRQKTGVPDQSTPVIVDQRLYMVTSGGIVSCLDTATGNIVWKERIGSDFAASPLAAAGRIYFCDARGKTTVIAPGDTLQILAANELADGCMASPAAVGKALILRTKTSLYRIEN